MEAFPVAVTHRSDGRALEAAKDRDAVGTLVLDVLLRQAEGKVTASPAGFVAARAAEQGVAREQAETSFGDVFAILERGPETPAEADLVAAFFAQGLRARLEKTDEAGRAAAMQGLLPRLDWLMTYSNVDPYLHVDATFSAPVARVVWDALARATLAEGDGDEGRVVRLLRTEVLCRTSPETRARLCKDLAGASDPVVAGLARTLGLGETAPATGDAAEALTGRVGPRPVGPVRRALALCTGWALLSAVLGAAGRYLLGFRRTMSVTIAPRGLVCRRKVDLLGKTIRESEEVVPFAGLASVERESRYPYLYLLVGVGGLALGAIWGVLRVFDGIRGAYAPLALVGLAAIALGVIFDLGLSALWPARKGRVSLTLLKAPKRWIRLVDVDGEAAQRFVTTLKGRLQRA